MRVTLVLALVFVTGCSQQELMSAIAPPEVQAVATRYIDHVRARRFDEIEQATHPQLRAQMREILPRMADALPAGEPTSRKLIGAHKTSSGSDVTLNLTFEYEFSGQWFVINVAWLDSDDSNTIVGLNVYPAPGAFGEAEFELAGKSVTHYAVLATVIALPFFTVYVLIACARAELPGRKWPWILFILFGFGTFAFDWSTGALAFQPLRFQLLSAGVTANPYGPWILTASLPIGAIVFLLKRMRARRIEGA